MASNAGAIGPDEIAEIIRMQQRADSSAGKEKPQARGINIKARTFAKPVKPIFEGKSVIEAMGGGLEVDDLSDHDEVSLSSVQNLQTIPSVSDGPGLFGMLASFSKRTGSSSKAKDNSNRIGELPNKAKLRQHMDANPVHTVDLKQNAGSIASSETENSDSGKRRSLSLNMGSWGTNRNRDKDSKGDASSNSNSASRNRSTDSAADQPQSPGDFPILSGTSKSKNELEDDDFFAAMDGDRPASMSNNLLGEIRDKSSKKTPGVSSETTKDRRAQRGNVKSRSTDRKPLESKESRPTRGSTISPTNPTRSGDTLPSDLASGATDWMPIVATGSGMQKRQPKSSIDESEHSLSSIAAKRRPLSKETIMAQKLAKKQHEELAALLAQSMEEVEELDDSVDMSYAEEISTKADWQNVVEEVYKKNAPLALSVDEQSESSGEDDILLGPKSREMQKVEEELKKQEEQLRAIIKHTAQASEVLHDTEVMTKIERKETQKNKSEWHNITDNSAKAHVDNLSKARNFLEEEEDADEDLSKPSSREARKLEDATRKQRLQLRNVIQETPDAVGALKVTKALSRKEKKATKKTKDEWHRVDTEKMRSGKVDYMEDQNDDEGGHKTKSKLARSLEEATRKQKNLVDDMIIDTPDASDALGKVRVFDDRQERKEAKKERKDWHRIDTEKMPPAKLDQTRNYTEDQNDDEGGQKAKSKLARSLEESTRKQKDLVDDMIIDTPDASDALGKVRVFDDRQERKETQKERREWYDIDSEMKRNHGLKVDDDNFYRENSLENEDATNIPQTMASQIASITALSSSSAKPDLTPSSAAKTNSASKTKTNLTTPTGAYPVFDAPVMDEDDDSKSEEPVMLLRKKIMAPDAHQQVEDPGELEPLDMQQTHDWHGVNPAHCPSTSQGSYKQSEDKDKQDMTSRERQHGSRKEKTDKASQKKAPHRSFEESKKGRKDAPKRSQKPDSSKRSNKPPRSRDGKGSRKTEGRTKNANFGWERVSTHSRNDDAEKGSASRNSRGASNRTERNNDEARKGSNDARAPPQKDMKLVSKREENSREQRGKRPAKDENIDNAQNSSNPNSPFDTRPEINPFNHRPPDAVAPTALAPEATGKPAHKDDGDQDVIASQSEDLSTIQQAEESKPSQKNDGDQDIKASQSGDRSPVQQAEEDKPSHKNDGDDQDDMTCESEDKSSVREAEVDIPVRKKEDDEQGDKTTQLEDEHTVRQAKEDNSAHKEDEDEVSTQSEDRHTTRQTEEDKPACKEDDDDMSTQSEDRHIVRQASRRTLLRRKVDDRREALASMFHSTQEHTLGTENEILDLKKKLALSQALVQMLEVENTALESRNQIWTPMQHDNREKELEKMIKSLIEQRDAAVMECHELRIMISGSCDVCRQRLEHHREYTMDYRIRNPILTKQNNRKPSAFEWLTAGLAEEQYPDNIAGLEEDGIPNLPTPAVTEPVTSKLPLSFLGKLLAEKVHDEFSSIGATSQQRYSDAPAANTQKKKTFFSSLFGESVDEDATFASIDPALNAKSDGAHSPKTRKLGTGLGGEKVLDDMEIFNSIMSISETGKSSAGKNKDNLPRFGLGDEKFNDLEHDQQLLSALRDGPSNKSEQKKKGLLTLRSEKFDDEDRDARLLGLLKESTHAATIEGPPTPIKARQSPSFGHLLSPTSKISSPFTTHESSPRKSVSTNKGRRGARSSVSYLGRFSMADSPNDGLKVPHSPHAQIDPHGGRPMSRKSEFSLPVDVESDEERPWQRDSDTSGTRTSNIPPSQLFLDEEDNDENLDDSPTPPGDDNYSGDMAGDEDEDFDQIAALLAIEGL